MRASSHSALIHLLKHRPAGGIHLRNLLITITCGLLLLLDEHLLFIHTLKRDSLYLGNELETGAFTTVAQVSGASHQQRKTGQLSRDLSSILHGISSSADAICHTQASIIETGTILAHNRAQCAGKEEKSAPQRWIERVLGQRGCCAMNSPELDGSTMCVAVRVELAPREEFILDPYSGRCMVNDARCFSVHVQPVQQDCSIPATEGY